MAKYLIDSTDIEIEEVSGTENLKFNLADGNSVEQMIGDLSNLTTTNKTNLVNALNEVNNSTIYSTTETVIGTYNGLPLYRKIVEGTTNNATTTKIATISNLNKIINLTGAIVANGYINPIGIYTDNDNWITYYGHNVNEIYLYYTSQYQNQNYYCVIEYTKS